MHRSLSEKRTGLKHTIDSSCDRFGCKPDELDEKILLKEAESAKGNIWKTKRELSIIEKSYQELQERIATDKSRLREINEKTSRRAAIEKELGGLLGDKALSELETELNSKADELNRMREEIVKFRTVASELLDANKELEKGEGSGKGGGGKCPVCETLLTQERKRELIAMRNRELGNIASKLKALESEMELKDSEHKRRQEDLMKASSLNAKIPEIGIPMKREDVESSLSGNQRNKEGIEKNMGEFRESLPGVEDSLRSIQDKLKIISMVLEFSEIEKKLADLTFDEDTYERTRSELEEMRMTEGEMRVRSDGLEREGQRIEETIRLQNERLSQLNRYSKVIEHIDSGLSQFSIFQNCIIDTQEELRGELITAINSTMTAVWASIYPYGDYKEIRLRVDDKGYDLEARIEEDWISVDGIASGGERAAACLALRIAFAMVLVPNLKWLILDEPTHNLDDEAVRSLSTALYERIPEIVEQIFVITHDETLKDAASGTLYRISRNKEQNEPSKAEKF
ncbi:MAG: hypothetical protein ABIG39_05765 [Candidatus Micrarchaeota archaeon]